MHINAMILISTFYQTISNLNKKVSKKEYLLYLSNVARCSVEDGSSGYILKSINLLNTKI